MVADALTTAVQNEKSYDPTIFLETRPKTLGVWMTECGDMPYELIRGTSYDFTLEGEPVRLVDNEQVDDFKRGYDSSLPL